MKPILFLPVLLFILLPCSGQDTFSPAQRAEWLRKAEACKPKLSETVKTPQRLVSLNKNEDAFQGWEASAAGDINTLYTSSLKKQSGVVVDFGEHLTGHFSCHFNLAGNADSDAPVRVKFTFGEVPAELATPFDPYPGGLSRAWLQDEIVTIDCIPNSITIPRRLSFRYVKIELLAHSSFDFKISGMEVKAVTSVTGTAAPLAQGTPQAIADIDRVGLATLRECMQTVYEDGPKRDMRLWIGDLYLEALANTYSYKNHDLTKRCLYMLAGLAAPSGFLHATVFETPKPHPQTRQHILDYALLWNVALLDYLKTTGDRETAFDLWPVAAKQVEVAKTYIGDDLMYNEKPVWIFFDWRDGLNKQAPLQGLFVKTFNDTYELAKMLGKEKEVADLPGLTKKMIRVARQNLYDSKRGLVVSGPNKQVSYLSQVWMTLGGIFTPKEAQKALKNAMATPDAVYPGSPYGTHYMIEALIACGLEQEAKDYLVKYWGGMVQKGADTFWEVYDPNNDFLSPYKFFPVNSYCHAWSCTPVYFIRKYPQIFQK
ncbi:MAG: glycoside hydrolase [Bacteroidales bacterium]|jgi:hypothetical protein|nr:glycoside hydrolase [Bacteroidales bacterium]